MLVPRAATGSVGGKTAAHTSGGCTRTRHGHTFRSSLGSDRGSIAASLLILPAVILAISLVIQLSLVMHGRNVAAAAAQDGLMAAQLDGATNGNGKVAAENTLALFEGIEAAEVTISRTDDEITVSIRGDISVPINGVFSSFSVSASGPIERFYLESERQ